MKKFFVMAAACLLALACANNNVKVSDPETDLAKVGESAGGDVAKASTLANDWISQYAKALAEKVITQEQFDAFVAGLTEKAGVPAETVKGFVETAKAALYDTAAAADKAAAETVDAAKEAAAEQVDAAKEAVNEQVDAAKAAAADAANQAANAANEAVKQVASDANAAINDALKQK